MTTILGPADRLIRITLGMLLLILGLVYGSWWGLLGLLPLISGLAGNRFLSGGGEGPPARGKSLTTRA